MSAVAKYKAALAAAAAEKKQSVQGVQLAANRARLANAGLVSGPAGSSASSVGSFGSAGSVGTAGTAGTAGTGSVGDPRPPSPGLQNALARIGKGKVGNAKSQLKEAMNAIAAAGSAVGNVGTTTSILPASSANRTSLTTVSKMLYSGEVSLFQYPQLNNLLKAGFCPGAPALVSRIANSYPGDHEGRAGWMQHSEDIQRECEKLSQNSNETDVGLLMDMYFALEEWEKRAKEMGISYGGVRRRNRLTKRKSRRGGKKITTRRH